MITKQNRPEKIWVDEGTEFAGAFEKICAAEGIQVYSTLNETKAAFAERTIRSLKNFPYRYMEDYAYKYIHKLLRFITTLNSRRNSSIDVRPNTVRNCDFMTVNLYENTRNLHSKLVIGCESQSMTCFFAKVTSHTLQAKFLKLWQLQQKKPPTNTIKDEQDEIIQGKFLSK